MKNEKEIRRKQLIRAFHSLCSLNGLNESEKAALKESFGVDSATQMSLADLEKAISILTHQADVWRKRVMAAIGAYLRHMHYAEDAEIIKGIACRASGYANFNDIPISKLRAIYNEFVKQRKTMLRAANEACLIINESTLKN
ncbi:MAG: hypothetical protein WHT22_07385 [Bacteroidales bacterium]